MRSRCSDKDGCLSSRVRLKRMPKRGRYDRHTIDEILDRGFFCHLGFVFDGYPVVLPTFYWRDHDRLYWHGSTASRMLGAAEGAQVCVAVTHFDGLVLARSAFNHSANYRSVTLMGTASTVEDSSEALVHLETMTESIIPGRWKTLRPVKAAELRATRVMFIAIDEASAKVRQGPPNDAMDYDWPAWAGVIPFSLSAGPAQCDREGKSAHFSPPTIVLPRTAPT